VTSSDFAPEPAVLAPDRKSVILRRYKYLSCNNISNWMIAAPMAVWQLHRFSAIARPSNWCETDPKIGSFPSASVRIVSIA